RAAADALLADPVDLVDPSRLVIDVASARRSYGRLAAYYDGHTFFPQERALFAAYARNAAAALDAATALEKARSQGATASALLKLARTLADVSTPDEVAQRLAELVPAVVGARAAFVLLWNATDRELSVHGLHGWPPHVESRLVRLVLRPPDSAGVTRLVTDPTPTFVHASDVQDGILRATVEGLEVDAVASVPIQQHGELLGLIVAGFDQPDVATVRDPVLERMAGVADHAATALQNGHLLERITHQALHDSLTGLPNRRLFEESVSSSLSRARRDGTSVALLFVDLDEFKQVNDQLGHEHGDRVLEGVADRMRASLRAGDVPARVGGDEFAVLLHDADRETALLLAERFRSAISAPMTVNGRQLRVSASIGIATHPLDGTTYDELLCRSDIAMYVAKANSGDSCRVYRDATKAEPTPAASADGAPDSPGDGLSRAS
ncbi:MAG: diguanylate cyclase, partial [Acidimicrobiia bacterium]